MASIKDLKKRIGSVKNTQQTTKAMKMVSAAKLRRAQEAITNNRPYAKQVGSLVSQMLSAPEVTLSSPLLDRSSEGSSVEAGKKLLLLVVTSDRGLCAGFNATIIKLAGRWLNTEGRKYESVTFGFLGKRGFDFYKTKSGFIVGEYFERFGGKVTFKKANDLSNSLCNSFLTGEFSEVKIIYNEFKNAVLQIPTIEDFLPLRPKAEVSGVGHDENVIVKPNANLVLGTLLEKHFAIQIFRVMLESQAGEHGARMSAMENATKNAGEMIKKLTLQYNKQRQAGITKELLEIISGSESSKSQAAS